MLHRSLRLLGYKYRKKYPHLVLYNKVPWEVVPAEGPESHELLAHHYAQFLELCARTRVANAVQDFHLEIPQEKWLHLLPGSIYVCPGVRSLLQEPAEWGPYQWVPHQVPSEWMQYYGVIEDRIGNVECAFQFKSQDLKLVCNAVCLNNTNKVSIAPRSALAETVDSGSADDDSSSRDITLFHFFRPNRAPSELVQPLEKYWQHHPDMSILERFEVASATSWKPVVGPIERKQGVRATMAPFKPLQQYTIGMPERAAVLPGGCFGSRQFMWGYWF